MKMKIRSKRVWISVGVVAAVVAAVAIVMAHRRRSREPYVAALKEEKIQKKLDAFGNAMHAALKNARGTQFDRFNSRVVKRWGGSIRLVDRTDPKVLEKGRLVISKHDVRRFMAPSPGIDTEGTGIDIALLRYGVIFNLMQASGVKTMEELYMYNYYLGMLAKNLGFQVRIRMMWPTSQ